MISSTENLYYQEGVILLTLERVLNETFNYMMDFEKPVANLI